MPRERKNRHDLFQSWIDSNPKFYGDLRIRGNEMDLFCILCGRAINSSDKSKVTRHVNSHPSSSSNDPRFFYDLTKAFVASDIPLDKLKNPVLRDFLEKYIDRKIPHPTTLRNTYVNLVYTDVVQKIGEDIAGNFVYFIIIIDEATDECRRAVANFFIGTLQSGSASASHLLAAQILDKIDHDTIVQFVKECFDYLWPNQDNSDKVLVMLTDADAYMIKAGKILFKKYSRMVHFTCAAHALHKIAETIKDSFPSINKFILNMKTVFLETHKTRDRLTILGDTRLPPEPVVTRWGTWLTAVAYYDEHFENIKTVIDHFESSESIAIGIVKDLMKNQSVHEDIRYINNNYSILMSAIQKLETRGLSLCDQFKILNDVRNKINAASTSSVSTRIKDELFQVFQKNPGYHSLENICNYLNGTYQELPSNIVQYKSYISNFAYCPVSSVDVERSFSLHKLILSDRRRNFVLANLEKILVIIYELRHFEDEF